MQEKHKPFPIYQDGELATELMSPPEPRIEPLDLIKQGIGNIAASVKLEARMVVFDAFHGTNYRAIRHNLMAQKRRERFEQSIGLIAVDKR